jgi:hypothetical protein
MFHKEQYNGLVSKYTGQFTEEYLGKRGIAQMNLYLNYLELVGDKVGDGVPRSKKDGVLVWG